MDKQVTSERSEKTEQKRSTIEREKILKYFKEQAKEKKYVTRKGVHEKTGIPEGHITKIMEKMLKNGEIKRVEYGIYQLGDGVKLKNGQKVAKAVITEEEIEKELRHLKLLYEREECKEIFYFIHTKSELNVNWTKKKFPGKEKEIEEIIESANSLGLITRTKGGNLYERYKIDAIFKIWYLLMHQSVDKRTIMCYVGKFGFSNEQIQEDIKKGIFKKIFVRVRKSEKCFVYRVA